MADMMMPEEMKKQLIEAMTARMQAKIDDAWRIAFEDGHAATRDKCSEWMVRERWKAMRVFLREHIASRWKMERDAREKGLVDVADGFLRERLAYTFALSKMDELEEAEEGDDGEAEGQ